MFSFLAEVGNALLDANEDERAFDLIVAQRQRQQAQRRPNINFYNARSVPSLAQSRTNFQEYTRPVFDPRTYNSATSTPEQRRAMQRHLEESFLSGMVDADNDEVRLEDAEGKALTYGTRSYTPANAEIGRDYQYRSLAPPMYAIPSNYYPGTPVIYPQVWHEEYDID